MDWLAGRPTPGCKAQWIESRYSPFAHNSSYWASMVALYQPTCCAGLSHVLCQVTLSLHYEGFLDKKLPATHMANFSKISRSSLIVFYCAICNAAYSNQALVMLHQEHQALGETYFCWTHFSHRNLQNASLLYVWLLLPRGMWRFSKFNVILLNTLFEYCWNLRPVLINEKTPDQSEYRSA